MSPRPPPPPSAAAHPSDPARRPPPRSLFQRFLDWYLGWLGRIFTGKF